MSGRPTAAQVRGVGGRGRVGGRADRPPVHPKCAAAASYRLRPGADEVVAWSDWRRAHQYRARASHDKRRKAEPPDG